MRNVILVFTSIRCFHGKSNSVTLSFQPVVINFQKTSSYFSTTLNKHVCEHICLYFPIARLVGVTKPQTSKTQRSISFKKYSLHSLQFDLMFYERLINKIFSYLFAKEN